MGSKITKSWTGKRAIAKGWMAWARASVLVIFFLTFGSCSAWHNGEPTIHVSSAQFQNPVAGSSHSGSGCQQHSPEISLRMRTQQFIQDNLRISVSPGFSVNHKYSGNMPINHAEFARKLAHSSEPYISWFFDQQIMAGTMSQDQVLRIYGLYTNPCFLAYIKRFPGYSDHILSMYARLINPANNRKKVFQEMGLKESIGMFNLLAKCAQEARDKRAAQEQERALCAQAAKLRQEELLHEPRKRELVSQQRMASRPPATLANCVTVWHKKQDGPNGARYKKRLAAVRELAQDLAQNKPKITRVYTITDRDHDLIKELNLRQSDFVKLEGNALQHVLHREFIGITRAISDMCTVMVGSITGQDWTELLGAYLDTGMQVNKMGNCAQASAIADFCWTITVGLGEIAIGVGEGIWQGGKNVAHMVRHPLDTAYGAGQAVCMIIMAVGDPDLPIDNEYSTFQRAHDPAQGEYLLRVYDTVMTQAKQATVRDMARGVTTVITETVLTGKLCSATAKCITSINKRIPGALHRALSCAPETVESFALAEGGEIRFSKGALQALAESEAAEARAAALLRDGVQGEKALSKVLSSKQLAELTGKRAEEILSYMKPYLDDLAKNGNTVKGIGNSAFKVPHTFSYEHIENNIFKIGKTAEGTAIECVNIIKKVDTANLLVEGINNIHTFVNDIPLEIRLFIKDGILMYFNGFVGHSPRYVKHLVKIEKGAIWKAI
jgi:hypothetical protein